MLSNGNIIATDWKNGIIIRHVSLDHFIQWANFDDIDVRPIEIEYPYYVGDTFIVELEFSNYIDVVVFYDLDHNEQQRVNISQHMINCNRDVKIDIDIVYLLDDNTILVIKGNNVVDVHNKYHVKDYSHYHKVFVNHELLTFWIVDVCFQ